MREICVGHSTVDKTFKCYIYEKYNVNIELEIEILGN